ncbi:MAG TPA: putative quinol monooxygenase [Caulobacteraceae bacterium]|nr:putative quinol monooxygenase [Caulobacteraceae bacterium]
MSVAVLIRLEAKQGREADLIALLDGAKAYAANEEPGCEAYEIARSREDPASFVIFQRYSSDDELERHRHTPHAQQLGPRLQEVLAGPGEVQFLKAVAHLERKKR